MSNGESQQHVLRDMIMTFRVTELQMLLGFAGRNKNGKKHELQARALDLVKIRSTPMQAKIKELYKASQLSQQAAMMNQGGPGQPGGMNYTNAMHYMSMITGAAGVPPYSANAAALAAAAASNSNAAALSLQGRNPYTTGAASGYGLTSAASNSLYGAYGLQQQQPQHNQPQHMAMGARIPTNPDMKYVKLPFYDVQAELLKPTTLPAHGTSRFHEAQFQFFLTPQQATEIGSNRDITVSPQPEYIHQIQLRFCQLSLENGKDCPDEFPPSVCVQVNGKMASLPNPIPTNKPGVEPKRPPRPVNITHMCKLSPILPNNVNIKWAHGMSSGWVVGIWLVVKLSSTDLLDRLKKKGTRDPEFTRGLIVEKLNDDDEVATTSIKVSVSCPLGKMRMQVPCRPTTCSHLQCFDASLFLQMNERKPTWNCPVCDSKALYDTLMIDGYFQEVLQSKELSRDENEIILESDGSWKPVPKDDVATKPPSSMPPSASSSASGTNSTHENNGNKKDDEPECIDLSDDDEAVTATSEMPPLPPGPGPTNGGFVPPPLPNYAPPPPMVAPPPPPIHPQEIECIDLD